VSYYLSDGTTRRGPFPLTELVAQGLRPESLVWADGMTDWKRADAVPDLEPFLRPFQQSHNAAPTPGWTPPPQQYGAPGPGYGQPPAGYQPPPGAYQPQPPPGAYAQPPQGGYPPPGYGQPLQPTMGYAPPYGAPGGYPPPYNPANSNRVAAGICGILFGALGVHKFVLGFSGAGLIMLLVTLLTCGVGGVIMGLIGFVEGIIYLTKSEEEFHQLYVVQKKDWF